MRVLFVCEGNVCRSPAAELLLARALPASVVQPVSAGLSARVGDPVAEETARLLRATDVDPTGFRARELEDRMLREADLVVVMATVQRAAVVKRVPAVLRRTWTLLDLAGTLQASGLTFAAGPDALLAARTGALGDVPDPWGRGATAHRRTFALVHDSVERLASAIR